MHCRMWPSCGFNATGGSFSHLTHYGPFTEILKKQKGMLLLATGKSSALPRPLSVMNINKATADRDHETFIVCISYAWSQLLSIEPCSYQSQPGKCQYPILSLTKPRLHQNYTHAYSSPCFAFSDRGIVLHQNVDKYHCDFFIFFYFYFQ